MVTVLSAPTWWNVRFIFFAFLAIWSVFALSTLKQLGTGNGRIKIKEIVAIEPGDTNIENELLQLPNEYLQNSTVLQHNFRYIVQPNLKDSCELSSETIKYGTSLGKVSGKTRKPPLLILVLVHSSASHFEHRRVIRETWASSGKLLSKVVFLLGNPHNETTQTKLAEEIKIHGDILQEDFHETYRNITLKALMGLKWAAQHCPRAAYVVKCDDDMFVSLRRLLNDILHQLLPPSRLLLCQPVRHASVERSGKYGVSKELYPFRKWPEFCFGGCWIASRDVISDLLQVSQVTPQIYLDDVYVTGILRIKSGLKITRTSQTNKLFCHARGKPERVMELWRRAINANGAESNMKFYDCFH